ncbi:MAG: NUDIX hydrolase [Thermomicrobiales bacterium]
MVQEDNSNPYYLQQPARRSGAGVLITNSSGEVLLVEPNYKPQWECPGGVVERGEDPRSACEREVMEELGLANRTGRLLVLSHTSDPLPRGDAIMFQYDGGLLDDPTLITLQKSELISFRFVPLEDMERLVTERLATRLRAAIRARASGATLELVNGKAIE